jgi:nitroreductase/dihydropteridine reductase
MNLTEALNWRYATKRMNGNKVPAEKLQRILDATHLAASSFGLQPYSVVVIENEDLRKKIQPLAYNQPQIAEASHLLVFAAWDKLTEARLNGYIQDIARERGVAPESLDGLKGSISGTVGQRSEADFVSWAARQAYIALGTALIAAAVEQVDATPMEGFDPVGVDALLGMKEKGLHSLAFLTLGYRDAANDQLAKAKKVRRAKDKLFIHMS